MEQLKKLIKEAEDNRIAQRTLMEREIDEMRTRLSHVDPEILEPLNIDLETLTCRDRFPSLYEDRFDVESYDKEKEEYIKLLVAIDAIREDLLEEVKKELGIETGGSF